VSTPLGTAVTRGHSVKVVASLNIAGLPSLWESIFGAVAVRIHLAKDDDKLQSLSQQIDNRKSMSAFLRKRRPTMSGTAIGPSSCTIPTIATVANPLITSSKEAATHRWHEGVSGHRKRIGRRVSSPQILLGRHQCAHQTLRCTSTPNNIPLPL